LKTTLLARATAVAAALLVLTACSVINPITSKNEYQASDGVDVAIGETAEGLNLLVMTSAKDAPAVLTGSIHNSGPDELVVRVSIDGTIATEVTVAPASTTQLGTFEGQTLVQGASPAAPGGLANVLLGTDDLGAITVEVPVMDGTIPPYQDVVDTIPPLPEPSPSASPSA